MNYVLFLLSTLLIAKHSSTKTIYQHFVTADWTFKPHAHVRTFHTDCLMVMDIICQPRVQNVFVWVCSALYLFFAFLFLLLSSIVYIGFVSLLSFSISVFSFSLFLHSSTLSSPFLPLPILRALFLSEASLLSKPNSDCKVYETLEFPPPLLLAGTTTKPTRV